MTMNLSGPISLAGTTAGVSIEIENGGNGTTQISLNDTAVRNLAGVPSGAITMPTNFYGKSNRVSLSYTFSATTANASLNLSGLGGYSAGKSDITVTVNSGIYLYATSTGNYGLSLSGGTTGDTLTVVNNGYIMGQGGYGGLSTGGSASAGGPALNIPINATINNTNGSAYIGGGGGGGGQPSPGCDVYGGGGGAGGGAGGNGSGGGGGGPGASGATGPNFYGGGGGRIMPGSATGHNAAGAGGTAGGQGGNNNTGGGAGGYANNPGGASSNGPYGGGGGGGYGASGGSSAGGGGAGGKAVNTNGKSVTWTSGDTSRVYGSVS